MKKTLLTSLIAAAVFAVVTPNAYAETANGTVITGNIYKQGNSGEFINGAQVNVICNGVGKNTVSDGKGDYAVEYTKQQCTKDDSFSVNASKGNLQGGATGTVNNEYFHVSFGMVDVFMAQVPEFGLVTGAMAALTSGSSLFAFRRMRKA